MTSAPDQTAPVPTFKGAPVYKPGTAPEPLLTAAQLAENGRRVLKDQKPAAWLDMWMPRRGRDYVPLYDPADSIGKRALSPAQQQAKAERRTCGACAGTFDGPLPLQRIATLGSRARWCEPCREADRNLYRRTCRRCHTVWEQLDSTGYDRTCAACDEHLDRARVVVRALEDRACPRCAVQTATAEEVAAARAANDGYGGWWAPRTCEPCKAAQIAEREEAERLAYRQRWPEVEPVRAWARELLADPATVFLDTETTGLHYEARIVEIAVYTAAGEKVLDTLVNPGGEPIPEEATEIHGITSDMVTAPGVPTFGELLPALTEALAGRRIVIYNREFDRARLAHELDRWHREMTPLRPPLIFSRWHDHPAVAEWIEAQRWEDCAMEQYAVFAGQWSEYHGSYTWQRLNGGHRAGGDCLAVADRLREIADAPDPT